jgi:hypothetical protein
MLSAPPKYPDERADKVTSRIKRNPRMTRWSLSFINPDMCFVLDVHKDRKGAQTGSKNH